MIFLGSGPIYIVQSAMEHLVAEAKKGLFPQNASEGSEDAAKKVLGHVCLSKEAHSDQNDISSATGSTSGGSLNSSWVIRFRERFRYNFVWKHHGFGTVTRVTKKKP